MLVLTRKTGESIVIADNITVTILESSGNQIRIGITAPAEVRIDRQEVHVRRQEFAELKPTVTKK